MWFGCPDFADVFVRREAFKGFQPPAKIISAHEVREMGFELSMTVVVEALDGRFLDGSCVRPGHSSMDA